MDDNRFAAAVGAWVDFCQRRAPWVLAAAVLLSVLAAVYLATNLRIDTDTEDMLSAELPFRQDAIRIDEGFPQFEDNLLVVLEAPDPDAADTGVRALAEALKAKPDVFRSVFAPDADPFLRKNGFLYMDLDDLEQMAARLAAAQPFLGTLWRAPNLAGLADMTDLLADAGNADAATLDEAGRVLARMAAVAETVKAGKPGALVWSDLILGREAGPGPETRLITVQPTLDYGSLEPAERASQAVYAAARDLGLTENGFAVKLTGSAALEGDELKSVEQGMGLAGVISFVLVTVVLIAGLRSLGMMAALVGTLVVGLIWTAAFAIFAVGALNLISVAFAVLFVGLSVDFGIHFTLRAIERSQAGDDWAAALGQGGRGVATSLGLCALTSAIAFFSFLPTAYVGLAELGLIAGSGMVVAFVANLTVLPALLKLLVRKAGPRGGFGRAFDAGEHVLMRRARAVVAVGVLSALIAGWFAAGARFDFDPMNLRDPDAPSMRTLFALADGGHISPYSADILADSRDEAEALIPKLEALATVDEVESLGTLIPLDQDAKLAVIDDMALYLGPAFFQPQGAVAMDAAARAAALARLKSGLLEIAAVPGVGEGATRLLGVLDGVSADAAEAVNRALFQGLPDRLETLVAALEATRITEQSLPDYLKRRFATDAGTVRIEVLPKADLRDPAALAAFAAEVKSVAPHATGAPIIVVEAGNAVLTAFAQALGLSLAGIAVVLWLVLRRVRDVALVFAPVVVAATWTLAVSAVFDVPFNFANVIVLPLLFGLSVDFALHLVMRGREAAATDGPPPLATTTPRAVLLSALTTLGSFGSIMLSGHPGTASMGLLLTIAIALGLVAILVFLPSLMALAGLDGRRV